MISPWVCHEASQAIARGIYAPARFEPIMIKSPYDRLQASDLIKWDGRQNHPGFQSILSRVNELLPEVPTLAQRVWRFSRANLGLLLTIGIATMAIALLFQQSLNVNRQLVKQEELAVQIERTLQPITGVRFQVDVAADPRLPGVQAYTQKLRAALIDPKTKDIVGTLPRGTTLSWEGVNGERTVSISESSPLWPREEDDWLFYYTVMTIDISIRFKKGGTIDEFSNANPAKGYDLGMDIGSTNPDGTTDDGEGAMLDWNMHDNKVVVSISDTPSTRFWSANGKIVSAPDIEKSFIKFAIMNTRMRNLDNKGETEMLKRNREFLAVDSVWLHYSGKAMLIRKSDLSRAEPGQGVPASFVADLSRIERLVGF
jgi:hypothetical protein